jgi:hypothetical protein
MTHYPSSLWCAALTRSAWLKHIRTFVVLLSGLQRPLNMNATSTAGSGSLEARDLSALQQQAALAAMQAGAPAALGSMAAPDGVAADTTAADGVGGGGSMAVDGDGGNMGMGVLGGGVGAAAGGSMLSPPGVDGGGSMVVGDNSTGSVNKKLFVKRSCTEAMLKVGVLNVGLFVVWVESCTAAADLGRRGLPCGLPAESYCCGLCPGHTLEYMGTCPSALVAFMLALQG